LAGTFSLNSNLTVPEIFRQKEIPSLTGLRALAIILVVLSHIPYAPNCPFFIQLCYKYLILGSTGVQLFFIISGFLITGLLLKEQAEKGSVNFRNFYQRRAIRILPAYFSYLAIILILKSVQIAKANNNDVLAAASFLSNVFNVGKSWLVAHSWTVSAEMQFYLLWPLAFVFLPSKYVYLFAVVIIYDLLYLQLRGIPYLFVFNYFFMPAFPIIFGAMLSVALYKNWLTGIHNILMHPVFGWTIVLAMIMYLPRVYGPLRYVKVSYDGILQELLLTLFLYYAVHSSATSFIYRILNNRIAVYIGLMSYSIYLWQQIFFAPLYNYSVYPVWTVFPLNVILALATASLSYNFIEKPFLRLKAKLK
jgi:peptidoglycan/LPS O-acetylase OafA/YrhL